MRILAIVLCMLTSSALAVEANWRQVVYEGSAVKSVDTSAYSKQICEAKAEVNNQAMRAGAALLHNLQKKTGLIAPTQFTVKCEQR